MKQPLLKKLSVTQACGSIRKPPSKLAVVRDANTGTGDEFTDGYDSAEESVGGGFGDSVNTLGKDLEVVRARAARPPDESPRKRPSLPEARATWTGKWAVGEGA